MQIQFKTKYSDTPVDLQVHLYDADPHHRSCRIDAICADKNSEDYGTPQSTLTVFLVGITTTLPKNMVIIKNYSENEGVLDCLIDQKIGQPSANHRTGDDKMVVFEITNSELLALMKEARNSVEAR